MSNNNQENERKQTLTKEQKQKMKKCTVFALMFIIFGVCMWLIFTPSEKDKAKAELTAGFNSDIPMPKDEGIIDNKKDAYEQVDMKQKQDERMRSLQDFSSLLGSNEKKSAVDLELLDEPTEQKISDNYASQNRQPQSSIQTSAQVYRGINQTLDNFYETPKEDPEKEQLKQELEELKNRMDENEAKRNLKDEQMEMMEKSFQMASKYMPTNTSTPDSGTEVSAELPTKNAGGKIGVVPISQVNERRVSALSQNMSSMDIVETLSKPRNMGFYTAVNETASRTKNTIAACVHGDQTVMGGQNVRLHLLETMRAGNLIIPRNTVLSGMAKITGERLDITINSLESSGTILPVELTVYDIDGQRGIFIPDLQELVAAKEILANMGSSAGTSINLSNDAGEQFVADMGRNLIQGVSQFSAKKLREIKIHLKAGYKVYLFSEEQSKFNSGMTDKQLANNK
jgi:conjugative transposon TraM protein